MEESFQKYLLATFLGTSHLCGVLLTSIKMNYKGINHNLRENSIREGKINVHIPIVQVSMQLNDNECLNCFL